MLGLLDLRLCLVLMRGFAKDAFEQPNKVKTREPRLASYRAYRSRGFLPVPQQIAREAKSS
jgi:hypothetical protein